MPLVELVRVTRLFEAQRVRAVSDVSLEVEPGEFLAVIGPSGSGKTTLLNLMAGLDRPTTGTVRFRDREPANSDEWSRLRATEIGFVFQAFHLLPTLTAIENVQIPMFGIDRDARRREQEQRAADLLSHVGLSERQFHLPDGLSNGEKQRVAIARSLTNSPSIVLADEPTGNLDSHTAAEVMDLLMRLRSQRSIALVLVTHNASIARTADRVAEIVDGRVVGIRAGGAG
jgi:putative ABC transport system ATP-binding protein